jgi:hypothetical protein
MLSVYRIGRLLGCLMAISAAAVLVSLAIHRDGLVIGVLGCAVLAISIVPALLPVVRRQMALRIDQRGIFLGGGGRSRSVLPGPSVLIPWDDVAEVVVCTSTAASILVSAVVRMRVAWPVRRATGSTSPPKRARWKA